MPLNKMMGLKINKLQYCSVKFSSGIQVRCRTAAHINEDRQMIEDDSVIKLEEGKAVIQDDQKYYIILKLN